MNTKPHVSSSVAEMTADNWNLSILRCYHTKQMFNMLATMWHTGGSCMVIQKVEGDPLVVSRQANVNGTAYTMV